MRYYISDLHFFHESLNTQMDCRGFKDAAQMNAYMIKQWNSRVRPKDEVVILGDFSVGKAKETNEVLSQLNGTLYMIKGNHDSYLKDSEFNKERFVWIKPYAEMHDNRRKVVLSHYPITNIHPNISSHFKAILTHLYTNNINNNITKMHPINPNSSPIIANIKSFCGSGM